MRMLLSLAVLLTTGCASAALVTGPPAKPFPTGALPRVVDGLKVQREASAQQAFALVGATSTVWHGELWSLRQGGEVVGSVQVAQLKGGLDTRREVVRSGVRGAIGIGHFRWFKTEGQWVGVQAQESGLLLYLWFPTRSDLFVVAQVADKEAAPELLVSDVIAATKEML